MHKYLLLEGKERCQMCDRGGSWDVSRRKGEHCKSGTIKGPGIPWQQCISYVETTSAGRLPVVLQYFCNSVTVAIWQEKGFGTEMIYY